MTRNPGRYMYNCSGAPSASLMSQALIIVLIYDVMCQWIINAARRERLWPENLRFEVNDVIPAIGKLHLPAHKEECHAMYSLNYIPGVGRSDGEWIERSWPGLNDAGASTKAMGHGAHHNRLDEIIGYANHRKCISLGSCTSICVVFPHNLDACCPGATLRRKLLVAIDEQRKTQAYVKAFSLDLAAEVEEWDAALAEREAGDRSTNPFRCSKEPGELCYGLFIIFNGLTVTFRYLHGRATAPAGKARASPSDSRGDAHCLARRFFGRQ